MFSKNQTKPVFKFTASTLRHRHLMARELVISEFGNPVKVVKMRIREIPILGAQDVLVHMLAAPVNPSDINTIQGKYPINLSLPHIPGNEGVGIVKQVGDYVRSMRPGHKVVVTTPGQGTWRDFAVFNEYVLKVVPNYLGLVEAATLAVNPCTAYRMLSDFKPVRQGNMSIIQNGANSACGQYVIQICKAWGIPNINIVRSRPKVDVLKSRLKNLGASFVLTEDEVKTTPIFKLNLIDKPSLALNCVGGKSASQLLRQLNHNGCMVTYGGMSKQPVSIPTTSFIFKNLTFCGFWMSAWNARACNYAKEVMLSELISLMVNKRIIGPEHKKVKFDDFQEALCNSLRGYQGCKYILDFR